MGIIGERKLRAKREATYSRRLLWVFSVTAFGHHRTSLWVILFGLLLCFPAQSCFAAKGSPQHRPNILFLLADDLGYGDLSCQNPDSKIRTPNLDRLASQGVRFLDAHAPSALCTPSRYAILTGQYCWRTRLKTDVLNMWDEPLIAPERVTVASLLRQNGYATGCFGKWHLGMAWPFVRSARQGFSTAVGCQDIDWQKRVGGGPVDRGFDYFFGVNIVNQPPYVFIENDHVCSKPDKQYPTVTGQQSHWAGPGVTGWDWSQVLPTVTSNSIKWIRQRSGEAKPFFGYIAFTAPHQPVVPSPEYVGKSAAGVYGDFVQQLDDAVGQILAALEQAGAATNTLVIFTSDNGPDEFTYSRLQQYRHASMGSLRGVKCDVWEGGHRVPFVARWPGKIAAGTTNDQTISLVDFMRTAAETAGATVPSEAAEDSVSFLPALLGKTSATRAALVLESARGQFGIRSNVWVYIDSATGDGHLPELEPRWFKATRGYATTSSSAGLLYDLEKDLPQLFNLYAQQPLVVNQMRSELRMAHPEMTWLGASGVSWMTAANWSPAVTPRSADLIYCAQSKIASAAHRLNADFRVDTITLRHGFTNLVTVCGGGAYTLSLTDGINMYASDADLTLQAKVALDQSQMWSIGTNRLLTVAAGLELYDHELTISGPGNLALQGSVMGTGRLRLRNTGLVSLGGTNSFSGGIELSGGGRLLVGNSKALGAGEVFIPNNSSMHLTPLVNVTNECRLSGTGALAGGISRGAVGVCGVGEATLSGPVALVGDTGLLVENASSALTLSGPVTGCGNLTVLPGEGTVQLSCSNNYSGATIVQGRLKLHGPVSRLPSRTDLWIANKSAARLILCNPEQSIASLAGGGPNGGSLVFGGATLRLNQGVNTDYKGLMSGTGTLVKCGRGTLTLSGKTTFSGQVGVLEGSLAENGTCSAAFLVAGGELRGTGVISGPVTISASGALAPGLCGNTPGVLVISNSLTLQTDGITRIRIRSSDTGCDKISGLASAAYGGVLEVNNLTPSTPILSGQTFRIFGASPAHGAFQDIVPAPGPGLSWLFDPAHGTLKAITTPRLKVVRSTANALQVCWEGAGFLLQAQTNRSGAGLQNTWWNYPGGTRSPLMIPIVPTQGSVLLRLVAQ